jgi:hypothetical protein
MKEYLAHPCNYATRQVLLFNAVADVNGAVASTYSKLFPFSHLFCYALMYVEATVDSFFGFPSPTDVPVLILDALRVRASTGLYI